MSLWTEVAVVARLDLAEVRRSRWLWSCLFVYGALAAVFVLDRFVWMLWEFGHDLDPKAPMHVDPFMPVVFGSKQIANFLTTSMPQPGALQVGVFSFGVWALTGYYLWRGRRESRAVPAAAVAA